jgi:hypothetical protein
MEQQVGIQSMTTSDEMSSPHKDLLQMYASVQLIWQQLGLKAVL